MNYLLMSSFSAMATASACIVGYRHAVEWQARRDRKDSEDRTKGN